MERKALFEKINANHDETVIVLLSGKLAKKLYGAIMELVISS